MLFIAYFSVLKKSNIKWSPNGMKPSKQNETFRRVIFGMEATQETWSRRQGSFDEATRQEGVPYPLGAPPPSWAPHGSPGRLLSPIYVHIP